MPLDKFDRPERAKNQTVKTPRGKLYLEIVRKLNEQGLQGEEKNTIRLFDCRTLGIVLIRWGYGGWKREWFDSVKKKEAIKVIYKVEDVAKLVDIKTLTALLPKKPKDNGG